MDVSSQIHRALATFDKPRIVVDRPNVRSGHRIPELDALRGVAALAIVVHHIWLPAFPPLTSGVNLFFVLSGYLITTIILTNRETKNFLATFYIRRALRIWPIYYLALTCVVLINVIMPVPESIQGLPYYLCYIQNIQSYWFGREIPFIHSFFHTWTLAIEEQYYLAWPLLLFAMGRRAVLPIALAVIGVSIVSRGVGFSVWILLSQCDGFALGGIMAVLLANRERLADLKSTIQFGAVALGVAAFAFVICGASALRSFGPAWILWAYSLKCFATNLLFFGMGTLIVCQSGRRWLAPLRARPLVYVGQISYGIYLYHYIILNTGRNILASSGHPPLWWHDVLVFVATFVLAALSWKFIEKPALALKDRFGYGSKSDRARRSGAKTLASSCLRFSPLRDAVRFVGAGERNSRPSDRSSVAG